MSRISCNYREVHLFRLTPLASSAQMFTDAQAFEPKNSQFATSGHEVLIPVCHRIGSVDHAYMGTAAAGYEHLKALLEHKKKKTVQTHDLRANILLKCIYVF